MQNTVSAELQNTLTQKEFFLSDEQIYSKKSTEGGTVWDTLARENPTHAVISAPDEASAERKSETEIEELLKQLPDGVLLDLGCGYGRIAKYLLPKRSFTTYIGLDSSYNMLRIFSERYQSEPREKTTPLLLIHSDIHSIPLYDSSVDAIIVSAVFLHNHKSVVRTSLREVERVLKPGGTLIVRSSFPNLISLMGIQGYLYTCLLALFNKGYANGPVRYYTHGEVKRLLSEYQTVTVQAAGFALLPKHILILGGRLNKLYRQLIANPVNYFLESILPKNIQRLFPTHHDVVAIK